MGERLQKLPLWARRLLIVISIAGPSAGAVATVVGTYFDLKARAAEASKKSEVGYETLAPAVAELQELLEDSQKRIVRLEAYIDIMTKMGSPMALVGPDSDGDGILEPDENPEHNDVVADARPSEPAAFLPAIPDEPPAKKAKRPVPQELDKAQMYQQQRVEMQCQKDDPLCGL